MGVTYEYTSVGIVDKYTSHEGVVHDSLIGLGYDWEQIGDPGIRPRYPFKIYLPQTTDEVIAAINETRLLGQHLVIRSKGHSSNDLVLNEAGSVLCTAMLNKILHVDEEALSVTVQAGAITAELDEHLLERGYGLPVLGDHNDITAGGFASVGGISPTSIRYGMFVDNVLEFQYVTLDGQLVCCSREENAADFYRLLGGTGQFGVLVELTVRIIRGDKYRTILRNRIRHYLKADKFIADTQRYLDDFAETLMGRGAWFDLPVGSGHLRIGQFSAYVETRQSGYKRLRNKLVYGYLHKIGKWAGRVPKPVEMLLKALALAGLVFSPRYASIKNVESFTDRITDSTVGDPTRWFILLTPAESYAILFRKLYELALNYRTRYQCFTLVSLYVKGIKSEYLSADEPNRHFSELTLYVGVNLKHMNEKILADLVSQIDDLCIKHGAYRYMHTKTVKDSERRSLIDPNTIYARRRVVGVMRV